MILQEIRLDYGFSTYKEVKNLINVNKLLRTSHHKKNEHGIIIFGGINIY